MPRHCPAVSFTDEVEIVDVILDPGCIEGKNTAELSPLDVSMPPVLVRSLRLLPIAMAPVTLPAAKTFAESFFTALNAVFPGASGGRFMRGVDGGWVLARGGAAAVLHSARALDLTLSRVIAAAADGDTLHMLCEPESVPFARGPLVSARVTTLSDGNVVLAVVTHHWLGDGTAHERLAQLWLYSLRALISGSDSDRGLELTRISYFQRPAELLPSASDDYTEIPLPTEYFEVGGAGAKPLPTVPLRRSSLSTVATARFAVARASAEALAAQTGLDVSTGDALMALLWQVVTRARISCGLIDEATHVRCGFAVDVRSRCGLAPGYTGNAVVLVAAELPAAKLSYGSVDARTRAASALRAANNALDSIRIRSAVAAVSARLAAGAHVQANLSTPPYSALAVSDWRSFASEGVLLPAGSCDGVAAFLPAVEGAIAIHLQLEESALRAVISDADWAVWQSQK